jgi:hypothetical protein
MNAKNSENWERFLTPEILRTNMISISVYISAFEILQNSIIERIKDFYWIGFNIESGDITSPEYNSKVLSLNRSPLYASLLWLVDAGAITSDDMVKFENIKKIRNKVAHELSHLLFEGLPEELSIGFTDMVNLLDKIEKWWILNLDIDVNPQLIGKKITEDMIIPGPIAGIKMMIDIALGTDEQAEFYINEFKKAGFTK